jgi:DNA-binding GntR family transcriptional regulator
MLFSIPGSKLKKVEDHMKIIVAVRDRNAKAAKTLMEEHILRSANEIISLLKSLPRK